MVKKVEDYYFSSLIQENSIPLGCLEKFWRNEFPRQKDILLWLNQEEDKEYSQAIK